MGIGSSLESVRGHNECPYDLQEHNWNDHPDEIDICDDCQQEKLCNVACHAPKSRQLYRRCPECVEKFKKQNHDKVLESIESIERALRSQTD